MKATKRIPLTQGKFAIVDGEDYECLSKHKWHAHREHSGVYYARSNKKVVAGKHVTIFMHRLILNVPEGMQTDHINHDGLDNRRKNLRVCTRAQNQHNRRATKRASSRYKGVGWRMRTRKWAAYINKDGSCRFFRYFRYEVRAAKAYDEQASKLFGEFACPNFPYHLRRRNIYRWLMTTKGRIFSVTFIKRSDGQERTIIARVGVTAGLKNRPMPFNPRDSKLIVVFDMMEQQYKCVPIDGIESVSFNGKRYRVD